MAKVDFARIVVLLPGAAGSGGDARSLGGRAEVGVASTLRCQSATLPR